MDAILHHIGFLLLPQTQLMDFAGPSDVFHTANQVATTHLNSTGEQYQIHLISSTRELKIKTSAGIEVQCDYTIYDHNIPLDTLLLTGSKSDLSQTYDPALLHWIKGIYPTLQRIGSICIGAFLFAQTGLLYNKKATTHWQFASAFRQLYPTVKLDYHQIYTKDGNRYTSGGITSGIDLALALVEEDHGQLVAADVSRYLVVQLKRNNPQTTYSTLLPLNSELTPLVLKVKQYITAHFKTQGIRQVEIAEFVCMSERNFARVFKKEAGMTAGMFYDRLRIEYAKRLLESSDLSIATIAEISGFSSDTIFRKAFIKLVQAPPTQYRTNFQSTGINNA
ncbi:GlxA family transcriptional regulator [Myroides odoratus]|uniref:GlxA family transcriptional regulator n=1 Tax=Myroides odoratus TaxID=256 RepID=A0A9Q6Z2T8_MYROD|nr:GlxA family transcriptional regulator [Myroides odoratus]EHQ41972.1 transcriptional regulator, AraC family with amidase-like domain [Myroides odoratus DSM 2801]EKB03529.1 hypothetical protein HMPREF9716_03559 [Myroides odoratus CIP 103059]QQT99362.1 GlxA family transcriptional regulator [Myroides odoratus]WQD58437.1 GlxA family transcriptional regulator [Myroides odoratus]STZ29235.1 Arabinose operon regulatory protein [Myroides odoratus]